MVASSSTQTPIYVQLKYCKKQLLLKNILHFHIIIVKDTKAFHLIFCSIAE